MWLRQEEKIMASKLQAPPPAASFTVSRVLGFPRVRVSKVRVKGLGPEGSGFRVYRGVWVLLY